MLTHNPFRQFVIIYLRGHILGRLYSDGGVPLPRRQDRHLIQKLINARHQVAPVFGLVSNIVENLRGRCGRLSWRTYAFANSSKRCVGFITGEKHLKF